MTRDLLFVSPVFPAAGGNGAAMRCHAFLRVLAADYRVHLLVVNAPPAPAAVAAVAERCAAVACAPIGLWRRRGEWLRGHAARLGPLYARWAPEPREWSRARRAQVAYPFAVHAFDCAHVFRLYAVPVLDGLAAHASWRRTQLDLDELESSTRTQLARLAVATGDRALAALVGVEARQYAALEQTHLRRFDRVFVSSAVERDRVVAAGAHTAPEVAPNVVALPPDGPLLARTEVTRAGPLSCLFVGTLGYAPNADAVAQFAEQVLPRLRARGVAVRFDVVGAGLPARLVRALSARDDVRLLGFVPDLAPTYRDADVVVVPVRAGGGTRIKILEAFAHGRPVVTTPVGLEGVAAEHEREVLVAELADGFAAACERLARDRDLAAGLGTRARELVRRAHSDEVLRRALGVPR